ncbi:MAG: TolB family protein [Armatimonadota bacterium]
MRRLLIAPLAFLILIIAGCGGSGGTAPSAPSEETLSIVPLEIGVAATAGFRQLAIPSPVSSPVALTAFYGSTITNLSQMGPGKIIFHGSPGALDHELYTIMPDGTGRRALTSNSEDDYDAAWSPNGLQIAFVARRGSSRDTYIMNADGTGERRLTQESGWAVQPAWSPDGQKLAFVTITPSGFDILTIGVNGGPATNITNIAGYDSEPDWSPDGRQIVFQSDRSGSTQIMLMRPDGGGLQALTDLGGETPSWSPDGQKIVFTSHRSGAGQVFIMNADGSGETSLGAVGTDPCFTFDGREIVFVRDHYIHIMRANGTRGRPVGLAGDGGDIEGVHCSPLPARARILIGANGSDGGSNPPFGTSSRLAIIGMTDMDGMVSAASLQVSNTLPLTVTPMNYGGNSLAAVTVSGSALRAMIEDRGRGLPVRRWAFPINPATGSATIFFSSSNGQIRSVLTSADVITPTAAVQGTRIAIKGSFSSILDAADPSKNRASALASGMKSTVLLDGNTGRVLSSQD